MKPPKEAIWLALLAAILMLLIVKGLGETPRQYRKRVERRIVSAHQRLDELDRQPYTDITARAYYELRAAMDMEMCRSGLHHYIEGQIPKAELDRLVKQLDRDMEDQPPMVSVKGYNVPCPDPDHPVFVTKPLGDGLTFKGCAAMPTEPAPASR